MPSHRGRTQKATLLPFLLPFPMQSLVLAPLFVWFELLFLVGLYRGLHAEVQVSAAAKR